MEVLDRKRLYFGSYSLTFISKIGLIYGRYLYLRFLKWPLNVCSLILVLLMIFVGGFEFREVFVRFPLPFSMISRL